MGKEEGKDWDLRTTFKVGSHFKIEEWSGKLWTATITRVEEDRVFFTDKNGDNVVRHRDDIKASRPIRGDEHGN
jgi:hypothetical protein